MADFTLSPNMNLPVPIVGVTAGPQYAVYNDNALTIIDAHTHTLGSGVQITPAALNINTPLTFQGNSLYNVSALTLTPQLSTPANSSLFEVGVDLHYVDGNGNDIRITQSGSLAGAAGTITGLPSGTASAAYNAGSSTFIFQSATATAANIDGGSYILRLGTPSSNALTLSPPIALSGGSYQLFLPTIPAQTNVMVIDNAGNIGSDTYTNVANNRIRLVTATTATQGNVVASSATAIPPGTVFGNPSFTVVLTATLTTGGSPVIVMTIPDIAGGNASLIATGNAHARIRRGVTTLAQWDVSGAGTGQGFVFPSTFTTLDNTGAGTWTYTFEIEVPSGQVNISSFRMVAYEL